MEKNIISHLTKIVEKSNNPINAKFDFSGIDTVNIFLAKRVLEKKDNLWFNVDNKYLDKFYEPIVFSALIYFFENNYCESKKLTVNIGDRYQQRNRRYEVTNIEGKKIILKCISRKDCGAKNTTCSKYINDLYTKIDSRVGNTNRDTFKPMQDFIKKTLGIAENIPSFPYKFAIVTQQNSFDNCFDRLQKQAFPYIYITDNGTKTENIPLADAMFFVASNYETIKEHVFDKEIKLELIVFIGNKYDYQIQQDIDRVYFKQAIFIGKKEPDVRHLKWRWTLPEYQYFRDLDKSQIKVIEVENYNLTKLIREFIVHIKELEEKHYIDLKKLLPYVSYTYPLVVLTKDSRLKNRVEDLLHSFEKKSKQVLGEEFSNIGEDDTEVHNLLVGNYRAILEQLYFEHNAKTQALQKTIETDYLLVPERQTLAVWQNEVKQLNWQKTKVISFNELKTLLTQSTITVLSLQDYDFYCSIRDSSHQINWLFYNEEYQRYQNFVIRYDNELIAEYKSQDRKKLIGIDYLDDFQSESIDDLQDRIWNNRIDKDGYTTIYQDYINKKITFTDAHKIELSANSTIVLIDQQNKLIKYKTLDLSIGDKIRVYDNQHKEVLFDIVSKSDENDWLNKILEHSNLWKKTLTDYCVHDSISRINEIASLCSVAYLTVEGWIKENSNIKFPKNIKPLKNILGDDYPNIHKSNKRYNGIMIALGRDLSDEVSNYIISKNKGKILKQFDEETINAISESNMPIRVISKIETINIKEIDND